MHERELELPLQSTVGDALVAAGLDEHAVPVDAGIWGRRAPLSQVLRESDRVELYRPLTVDPKVARRERFRKQGARGTGLFASRRPGSKSGY